MGELAKIDSFRREVAIAETIEEIQLLRDAGEAYQKVIQKNKGIAKTKVDEIGEYLCEVEEKEADWLNQFYPHGGINKYNKDEDSQKESSSMPVAPKESARARKLKRVKEKNPELYEQAKEKIKSSEEVLNPKTLYKEIRKEEKKREKEDRKNEYKKQAEKFTESDIKIFKDDFYEFSNGIEDNSIDLILTDPPYPGEYLYLWEQLFEVAQRILKPSSFLIAYSGQMYLDKIFRMKNDLIYYWTANIIFSQKPLIHGRNIINEWKPILIFQKPPFKKLNNTIADTIAFDYSERDLHNKNWGQTVKPFEFLINNFSEPNDLILEPFAGTGTTLLACKNTKRRCLGIEIDEELVKLIKGRLS